MTGRRRAILMVSCAVLAGEPVLAGEHLRTASPETGRITAGEIETYAKATSLVRSIRNDLANRVQRANTPQQAAMLVQAADSAMAWVVENEGLSLDRYNEISRAARADPELRGRILAIMGDQR